MHDMMMTMMKSELQMCARLSGLLPFPIIWIQGILNSIFSFLSLKNLFDKKFDWQNVLWNIAQSDLSLIRKEPVWGVEASEWKEYVWNFQRSVFVQSGVGR